MILFLPLWEPRNEEERLEGHELRRAAVPKAKQSEVF
jgi:hypothetical protein